MEQKRLEWVDLTRLTAMVLVVLLHFGTPYRIDAFVHLFHMPVFYVLSGYCLNNGKYRDIRVLADSRAKSLIMPYLIWSILFYSFWTFIIPNDSVPLLVYIRSLLYTNTTVIPVLRGGVQWFLPSLYIVEVFYCFCMRFGKWKYISVLVTTSFGFIIANLCPFRMPLAMDTALVMLLFYALGNWLRERKSIDVICTYSVEKKIIIILLCMSAALLVYMLNGYTNVREMTFGNPVLYVIGATCGSIGLMVFSTLCDAKKLTLKKQVMYLGRNTIILLYLHRLYLALIRAFIIPGSDRYLLNLACVVFFFIIIANPCCRFINHYLPWLSGRLNKGAE